MEVAARDKASNNNYLTQWKIRIYFGYKQLD